MRRRVGTTGAVAAGILLAAAVFVAAPPPAPANSFAAQATAQYGADSSTILFDDFESTTRAESFSANCTFAVGAGYLSGTALRLSDTAAHAFYSESWVRGDTEDGIQDSGTIEIYIKPESFVFTNSKFYPSVLTQEAHPVNPATANFIEFGFFERQPYFALSDPLGSASKYAEVQSNTEAVAGQWTHLAATWGPAGKRLYVNGELVATGAADGIGAFRDSFTIGIPPGRESNTFRGISFLGLVDRLRLSAGQRGVFPTTLQVVIDSPGVVAGETFQQPFPVTYRAFESDTRAKSVNLYLDTDGLGFNGALVASGLAETGTVSIGGVAPDTYFIVAVAFAGSDTASYVTAERIQITNNPTLLSLFGSGLGGGEACLFARAAPRKIAPIRSLRDLLLGSAWTRWIVSLYYTRGV